MFFNVYLNLLVHVRIFRSTVEPGGQIAAQHRQHDIDDMRRCAVIAGRRKGLNILH